MRIAFMTTKGQAVFNSQGSSTNTLATVTNLINSGFFEGMPFYQVGNVIQQDLAVRSGANSTYEATGVSHIAGVLTLKTSSSGASQFKLLTANNAALDNDGIHSAFARCVVGMDVLLSMTSTDVIIGAVYDNTAVD